MFQTYQRQFWRPEEAGVDGRSNATSLRILTGVLALLVLALGIWSESLLMLSQRAAQVLS
jgi:hypothetical protein